MNLQAIFNIVNKKCATWHKVVFILLLIILLVTPRVQAQEQETLILYEVTENNFPSGDGVYSYDMNDITQFDISTEPEFEGNLEAELPDNYEVDSLGSRSSIANLTVTAIQLEAINWTYYAINNSHNITYPEQIMFIKIEETDIDFTRTIRENESFTVEVSDQYDEFFRTIIFQLIPYNLVHPLEGRLKLTLTIFWELTYPITLIPTTSPGEPILAVPVLGAIGLGLVLLVYYFREEK